MVNIAEKIVYLRLAIRQISATSKNVIQRNLNFNIVLTISNIIIFTQIVGYIGNLRASHVDVGLVPKIIYTYIKFTNSTLIFHVVVNIIIMTE